jgi:hypothetical protein
MNNHPQAADYLSFLAIALFLTALFLVLPA